MDKITHVTCQPTKVIETSIPELYSIFGKKMVGETWF